MVIKNGMVLIGKRFVRADIQFEQIITEIGRTCERMQGFDAEGCYVLPGLVDIHTHGAVGRDFSDGVGFEMQPMADYYGVNGVTSFLATTMTLSEEKLTEAVTAIGNAQYRSGAKCAGIHLEGPFLSEIRKGAQSAEYLQKPDIKLLKRLNDSSGGRVKMITVAPEEPDALEFIRAASRECAVSLGHTDADYDTAMRAFEAGATHVTHLYNGMAGLHHREPGVIGAAMDADADVELICDGLHVHPAVVRLTAAVFGEKLNLISDSMRCAGMPDGSYELGGQQVCVSGGKATLCGTDVLAGSSISLLEGVRRAVAFGIPLEDAAYAASTAPAKAVGLTDVGSIEVGKCADLIVLDKDLNLKLVFINGKREHQ